MVTKTLKSSTGPLKITIPCDIKELTMGMLVALTPKPGHDYSQIEQLSILSGIPLEAKQEGDPCLYELYNLDDIHTFDVTLQKLAFQLIAFRDNIDLPLYITLEVTEKHSKRWFNRKGVNNLKTIPVITNLGIQPAGAYMEAKELIRAEFDEYDRVKKELDKEDLEFSPSVESLIRLLSLYFYVPATGNKFHPERVAEFDEVIKKLPITKALPIARYFFLKYPNLAKPKVMPSKAYLKTLRLKPV